MRLSSVLSVPVLTIAGVDLPDRGTRATCGARADCPTCRTCRGPVQAGYARCYQCDLASRLAGGLLADAVVPIGYAVKGGELARDLRLYKSGRAGSAAARERLRQMLAGFLRDHGPCVWGAAGMTGAPGGPGGPVAVAGVPGVPVAVAVVPSGQGRPGDHPLLDIVTAVTPLPVVSLSVNPGGAAHGRVVSTGWLRVRGQLPGRGQVPCGGRGPGGGQVPGANVLLVEDTWVSGASAQSAAAALKLAGAARVAVVVLGRHVEPADARSADLVRALAARHSHAETS